MNYFHAQLGKAVRGSPFKCEKARRIDLRVLPLFRAQLGQKPIALARETPAEKVCCAKSRHWPRARGRQLWRYEMPAVSGLPCSGRWSLSL